MFSGRLGDLKVENESVAGPMPMLVRLSLPSEEAVSFEPVEMRADRALGLTVLFRRCTLEKGNICRSWHCGIPAMVVVTTFLTCLIPFWH